MGQEQNPSVYKPAILIVDDEVEITSSLARSLRGQFTILSANSAAEAINILENNEVAIILTDQRMPGGSGLQLLEAAKNMRPDSLGIIFTGYSDISVLVDAINLGTAKGYIPKPWDLDAVKQILSKVSRQYQAVINDRQILASTSESLVNVRKEIQELRIILDHLAEGQMDALFQVSDPAAKFDLSDENLNLSFDRRYIDHLSDGIAILNHDGVLEYANDSFQKYFDIGNWHGKYQLPLKNEQGLRSNKPLVNTLEVVLQGEYILADCSVQNSQGDLRHIEIIATPLEKGENRYNAVLVARDQTVRQQAIYHLTCLNAVANATSQSVRLHEVLPAALKASCSALNADGYIIFLVDNNERKLMPSFFSGISNQGYDQITSHPFSLEDELAKKLITEQTAGSFNLSNEHASPFIEWTLNQGIISMAYIPIRVTNSVLGLMIIFSRQLRRFTESDITVLTSMGNQIGLGLTNANLHEMVLARSQTDELTGIMNRRYFMEILTLEYERCLALNSPLTLMMLDMDNFKEVNDSYGHLTGDEVLKLVGKRLAVSVRPSDYVARYGGDEFIILLKDSEHKAGRMIANRIKKAIASIAIPVKFPGDMTLGISIGIASLTHTPPEKLESLISRADQRLYSEKSHKTAKVFNGKTV